MVGTIVCLEVNADCPVQGSIYGYFPSRGANAFFTAAFAILFIALTYLSLKWKTKFFMWAVGIGVMLETLGYGGRIMLASNPYSDPGFKLQIVCLTLAPAFLAAGIYVLLQQLIMIYGERHSRLPARYYTWVFITCDFLSIVLQGVGGGVSSGAETQSAINAGNNLMIAGVAFQVFTLTIFAILVLDWMRSAYAHRAELNPETYEARHTPRFRGALIAAFVAFVFIYLRCVYRIAEMAKGWANPIMQDEPAFIVCESVFILIAVGALAAQHPGIFYQINRLQAPSPSSVTDAEKAPKKKRFGFGKK